LVINDTTVLCSVYLLAPSERLDIRLSLMHILHPFILVRE
jgi:hypothetical protein